MIQLDDNKLRQLQKIEIEMLLEIDRICRKHKINYTIIGGTLLGAVRHGGFIPWDDDADVAMLRPEYERFCKVCEEELDNTRFYFQDMDNTPGYRWGYGKFRRKDSLFLRENQEHMPYEQGVFIDIFPQDATPDNAVLRRLHDFSCFCVRKLLWSEVGKKAEHNCFKRICFIMLSKIPFKLVQIMYRGLIIRNQKTELVRTLTFPAPKRKYGYKRVWLTETDDIKFEQYTLRGVKDYDGWLRWEFGKYMDIPPEHKRKTHPITAIILPNIREE